MWKLFIMIAIFIGGGFANANGKDHQVLGDLKDSAIEKINTGKFEELVGVVSPNIVLTAEDNTVVRGVDSLMAFCNRLLVAEDAPLKEFKIRNIEVDELSILYGDDTAIAFGDADLFYKLSNGSENTFQTRWTATLVKESNKWLLAAFHNSVDFTDNPLLNFYSKWLIIGIIGALIVGFLLGFFISRFRKN